MRALDNPDNIKPIEDTFPCTLSSKRPTVEGESPIFESYNGEGGQPIENQESK